MQSRAKEGERISRALFGWDGELSREQAYRMIDQAPRGTVFYRIVVSPAPRGEDTYRDLSLADMTIDTLLALEERLGRPVQFAAAVHDDHSPARHVHILVLLPRRLSSTLHIRVWRHPCDWRLNHDKAEFFDVTEITRHREILPATTG